MNTLIFTIITLCVIGVVAAVILYFVAQKFKVEEDPRIDDVEKMLPGANCGGCGFPGCRGLATALVEQDDISSLYCSVGGADCMKAVADYLGKAAPTKEPQVATVRCGGTCEKRPRTSTYAGTKSCAIASVNTSHIFFSHFGKPSDAITAILKTLSIAKFTAEELANDTARDLVSNFNQYIKETKV